MNVRNTFSCARPPWNSFPTHEKHNHNWQRTKQRYQTDNRRILYGTGRQRWVGFWNTKYSVHAHIQAEVCKIRMFFIDCTHHDRACYWFFNLGLQGKYRLVSTNCSRISLRMHCSISGQYTSISIISDRMNFALRIFLNRWDFDLSPYTNRYRGNNCAGDGAGSGILVFSQTCRL